MKIVHEIAVADSNGLRAFSGLLRGAENCLADFVTIGGAGTIRKALHSALVAAGWGTEITSLYSEHGANATLPGGVYSLPPFQYYSAAGVHALSECFKDSGFSEVIERLRSVLVLRGGIEAIPVCGSEVRTSGEGLESIELPGFSALSAPTPEDWSLFQSTVRAVRQAVLGAEHFSRDELLRCLAVLLMESGLPQRNLRRYRHYYRMGSFIFIDGQPRFFAAVYSQADNGLGLLPMRIRRPYLVKRVLKGLEAYGAFSRGRLIFADFELGESGLRGFLSRRVAHSDISRPMLGCMDRSASFICTLRNGGFLASTLRDQLLAPANWYEIGDLLSAMGFSRQRLRDGGGEPWHNCYCPSKTQAARVISPKQLILLLREEGQKRKRGRPRKIPKSHVQGLRRIESWSDSAWAALLGHYWSQPSHVGIKDVLVACTQCSEDEGWKRASRIYRRLLASGKLATSRPLRLVAPSDFLEFVKRIEEVHIPEMADDPEERYALRLYIRSLAALGARPQEARNLAPSDYTDSRSPALNLIRLHGGKTRRANREILVEGFAVGPCGRELVGMWNDALLSVLHDRDRPERSVYPPAGLRILGRANAVLKRAFHEYSAGAASDELDGDHGGYTCYALRHAVAIRLVQGAIDRDFLRGNFQASLSWVAAALGHSYAVLVSHYLGSAALILQWPRIGRWYL